MRMKDKVTVVTGASMGIGEAIAKVFVAEGGSVVLSSRDLARVEEARSRIGSTERTFAVACDVRLRSEIDRLAQETLSRFGRMDIWVNNAGYGLLDSTESMDMGECRLLFDTNVFGAVEGMQAAIATMRKQGYGTIINISSVAGHIPVPYMGAYCATKHALNAFGKAARMELMGTPIHVMTVCPGYIRTNFGVNAVKGKDRMRIGENLRRGITPERVARAVMNGYLRRTREVCVPWTDRISIGLYKRFPAILERIIRRLMKRPDGHWAD